VVLLREAADAAEGAQQDGPIFLPDGRLESDGEVLHAAALTSVAEGLCSAGQAAAAAEIVARVFRIGKCKPLGRHDDPRDEIVRRAGNVLQKLPNGAGTATLSDVLKAILELVTDSTRGIAIAAFAHLADEQQLSTALSSARSIDEIA